MSEDEIYMGNEISNDLRDTISTFAVMQSCSTEVGQTLTMTGSLITWVHVGLVSMYGYQLAGLDEETYNLMITQYDNDGNPINNSIREQWKEAIAIYNSSRAFWGTALMMCNEVATQLISICAAHNMMDYALVSQSVTKRMQQMNIVDDDEHNTKGYGPKKEE